jgi:NAD(P)H-dependent FMN reductase
LAQVTAVRLLGILGSIRRGSSNAAVLEAVSRRLLGNGIAELVLFGLQDVPIYNADFDGDGEAAPSLDFAETGINLLIAEIEKARI